MNSISQSASPLFEKDQDHYDLEALMEDQGEILEMIMAGKELHEILNAIVLWVEKESREGVLASILLMDEEGERLMYGAAPSLPESYNHAIHGITIGPGVGSCGTAAFIREPVIVDDIETDPLWANYRDLALSHHLKACWSTPLINKQGMVLGTFAMYYSHSKKPDKHDLQVIRLISNTAVLAIEWKRIEQEKNSLLESERNAYDKVLMERHKFYHLLMQAPALVSVLKGPEHIFELANDQYRQVVGIQRDIIGKPIREALPELHGQGLFEILDKVYTTGENYYGSELLVKLDTGKEQLEDVFFNFVYQPIKNEEGKSEGIFVHAVDVTELVKAKKRAEKSEEMFRSFVLSAPMPIGIYVGKEMRIQIVNEAILKAWEKDESVIGKTFREALPELEGQPFSRLLDEVYTTGKPYQASEDRVYLMRDGKMTPTYWSFNYKALTNENGEIFGVINTGTEVTELVIAKQKLLSAEETLTSAIDVAELGTWSIDISNNFVVYSEKIADWFGLPGEGAKLDEVIARVHKDEREKVTTAVNKAISTRGIYEAEYRVLNPKDGRERILYAKGQVAVDSNGGPVALEGVCKDITLQKETEKELTRAVEQRTIELKEANVWLNTLNEHLKQFVYVASHDLQEPLRKINIFSDMLRNRTTGIIDKTSEDFLSKITRAAQRMTNLIKDLLDFSKAEAGGHSFLETDLNMVLKNVIDDYEMMIHEKKATVTYTSLPVIEGISLQMNQLFYNLLGNALKFSKDNVSPVIHISSRMLEDHEVEHYEELNSKWKYVEIVVQDNGIGFDPAFADQIFIIFQRLHGKDQFEGTGIGLALCKKITENHGGLIFAEGKDDEGAAFHIILPVKHSG